MFLNYETLRKENFFKKQHYMFLKANESAKFFTHVPMPPINESSADLALCGAGFMMCRISTVPPTCEAHV
jgi:hypothetical protein